MADGVVAAFMDVKEEASGRGHHLLVKGHHESSIVRRDGAVAGVEGGETGRPDAVGKSKIAPVATSALTTSIPAPVSLALILGIPCAICLAVLIEMRRLHKQTPSAGRMSSADDDLRQEILADVYAKARATQEYSPDQRRRSLEQLADVLEKDGDNNAVSQTSSLPSGEAHGSGVEALPRVRMGISEKMDGEKDAKAKVQGLADVQLHSVVREDPVQDPAKWLPWRERCDWTADGCRVSDPSSGGAAPVDRLGSTVWAGLRSGQNRAQGWLQAGWGQTGKRFFNS